METRAAAKTNRSRNPIQSGESTEEITQLQAENSWEVWSPCSLYMLCVLQKLCVSLTLSGIVHWFRAYISTQVHCCRQKHLPFLRKTIPWSATARTCILIASFHRPKGLAIQTDLELSKDNGTLLQTAEWIMFPAAYGGRHLLISYCWILVLALQLPCSQSECHLVIQALLSPNLQSCRGEFHNLGLPGAHTILCNFIFFICQILSNQDQDYPWLLPQHHWLLLINPAGRK